MNYYISVLMLGKIKLILTIYFLVGFFSFGQNGLYSIMVKWIPNKRHLVKINPTGPITQISPSSIFDWYDSPAGTTIDPNNNIYYVQVRDTPQSNSSWLYGIDLSTGNVVSSVLLANSQEFHQMKFNCKDSTLYAIMVKWSPNERYLVKINPSNGQITQISPSSIFDWYDTPAGTTIDPNNNIYYVQVRDTPQSNSSWLYGIDLSTGNVVSSALLANAQEFHQMVFNCEDSTLYAIMVKWTPNKRHLVKISPTGQVTQISPSSIFDWYDSPAGTTIDPSNNLYYVQVRDTPQSNSSWLYGIDLSTGNAVSTALLANSQEFHQMVFNQKCETSLDFLYQNTCIGNTTEFYSSSCSGSFEWDFGDPVSGANNYSNNANPTHAFSDTGYYDVKLKLISCCYTDSIIKTVYVDSNNQIAMLPNDFSICLGDTISLDVTYLSGTYYWQDSSSNPSFQVTSPGVYWISENICNTADTIVVTYDSFQNFDLGYDTTLCIVNVILDAGNSGVSYLWQDGSSNQQYAATTPGVYSVQVIDTLGCTESDTVEIFLDSISVELGNDTLICTGSTLILDASTLGSNYLWQDGTTNSTLPADTSGIYTVFVQSGFCSTVDTIQLIVDDPNAYFTTSDTMGCPPLLSSFQDQSYSNQGSIVNWSWDFGDNSTSTLQHPNYSYSLSGTYAVELTVTTSNGCFDQYTNMVEIEVYDQPTAQFSTQPNPGNIGEQILFVDESTSATSWTWVFNDSTYSTDQNPIHIYLDAQEYNVLLIVSSAFCSDTISQVVAINEEMTYYIPNSFTPNGDEINNIFRPIFTPGYEPLDFKFLILNRSRDVIFESNDATVGWDGTYNGKYVQDGTYVWIVEFKESIGGQRHINLGHVNLLR
ncbi:MAG: PKD domain-containing protein [Crocinitomicaceae bacterium]|nr:PKD domain-containing protein [Flavobacteriales bacterium]NQZ36933.1 PKD domain-containing protein [Crocinitomicaceae bacterium]